MACTKQFYGVCFSGIASSGLGSCDPQAVKRQSKLKPQTVVNKSTIFFILTHLEFLPCLYRLALLFLFTVLQALLPFLYTIYF